MSVVVAGVTPAEVFRVLKGVHSIVTEYTMHARDATLEDHLEAASARLWKALERAQYLLPPEEKETMPSEPGTDEPTEPSAPALPDPKAVGREYRKTATAWAVQMTEDFTVETLEGTHQGRAGDWLAQGPAGERWPIKAEIFAATYVPVEP